MQSLLFFLRSYNIEAFSFLSKAIVKKKNLIRNYISSRLYAAQFLHLFRRGCQNPYLKKRQIMVFLFLKYVHNPNSILTEGQNGIQSSQ